MQNQSPDPESIGQIFNDSGANNHSAIGKQETSTPQSFSVEDINIEALAKKALDETIQEGGAFARENPDQFKI